ncbi:MAG: DNA repair protein RecO [Pseudobdellovibrionaceae bacterium]
MSHKEKVIILRKVKYGEADLVVQCLSQKGAKMSFLARGALKSKKRFGGGILEPSHYVEIRSKENPSAKPDKLTSLEEAQLVDAFQGLRSDYDRLKLGLLFVELISKISREGDVHSENLFNLLGHALKIAEQTESPYRLRLHFIVKLLKFEGVLTPEEWMKAPLGLPISKNADWILDEKQAQDYLAMIEPGLRRYLLSAESL